MNTETFAQGNTKKRRGFMSELKRLVMCALFIKEKRIPIAGERWVFKDGSPWGSNHATITILDVKDNWVRYDMGGMFRDERMKMSNFLYCYQPCDT